MKKLLVIVVLGLLCSGMFITKRKNTNRSGELKLTEEGAMPYLYNSKNY